MKRKLSAKRLERSLHLAAQQITGPSGNLCANCAYRQRRCDIDGCYLMNQAATVLNQFCHAIWQIHQMSEHSTGSGKEHILDVLSVLNSASFVPYLYEPVKYARTQLVHWIYLHRGLFRNAKRHGVCYGKIDEKYVYIINRYFLDFCNEYGYDSLHLLRAFRKAGFIATRTGSFHGGHYKTTRICRDVESCVWLLTNGEFNEMEDTPFEDS